MSFLDYAYTAGWRLDSCDGGNGDCGGADVDGSGIVDERDVGVLCGEWMDAIDY